MIVALASTLDYPRACIAAGILQANGLFAEVWDEPVSFIYGPLATGGFRVVVNAEEVAEACAILNERVPPAVPDVGEIPDLPPPLACEEAIAIGAVAGAVLLPLLLGVMHLLNRALLALQERNDGYAEFLSSSRPVGTVFALAFAGAFVGLAGGLAGWLLFAYRRGHPLAVVFVVIVTVMVIL